MAPCGRLASPPLRRASSEGRLLARQHTGAAVMGLPELKRSSSVASGRLSGYDNHGRDAMSLDVLMGVRDRCKSGFRAAPQGRASEKMTPLPSIFENTCRGMFRQPTPPERPAKRSRSSAALCSADVQKTESQERLPQLETRSASKLGSQVPPPALSSSQSAADLPSCRRKKSDEELLATCARTKSVVKSDDEVEQVLRTALGLCGETGVHKASQEHCRPSSALDEMEAHLEELLGGVISRSVSPEKKVRHARVSDARGDNENKIRRKGTGFVHLDPSENSAKCEVKIDDEHGDNENNIHRKGTGFLYLDPSDKLAERHARIEDGHGDNENNIIRKGTGFVHLGSSMSEANVPKARILDDTPDKENKLRRKGTGFVHVNASPEKKNRRCVRIHDHHGDNENKIRRNGTGFVHFGALPQEPPAVWFPDMTGGNVNRIQRKGTGFIVLNHVEPRVRIAEASPKNNLHRQGTGFVDLSEAECESLPYAEACLSGIEAVDSSEARADASNTVQEASYDRHGVETVEENLSFIETM